MGLGTYGTNVVNGVAYSAQYCQGDNETKDLGQSCSLIKNPINAATGNKFQLERDYIGAGDQPLRFERFYNSAGTRFAQTQNFGPAWAARIGLHWRHTYDRSINLVGSATLTTAFVYRPDGKAYPFNFYNDLYYPDRDISSRLLRLADGSGNPTGWEYRNAEDDSIELYDVNGRLISITSLGGLAQTLVYDGAGRLSTVTDAFGRQLTFSYDASNRITTMADPAGGQYLYSYDAASNLATVTRPGSQPRTYLYNEAAFTSGTSLPHALTGIIDENSQRFATYRYDSLGRATSTEHAGGAEAATVAYNANGTTTVTDALGTARNYGFQTILGVRRNSSLSQPCEGCGGGASATVYDANGNATTKTDFNGNQTTYVYDLTRNLETSRTEAFGTPRARTITTIWHPTFRLPTQIDEPNRRTTLGYDSNGNLLTRTTTNLATSQTRAWTFTYNGVGQALSANGPRLDVNDVTTYTYHNCSTGYQCGQVQTITNALGQVTTFNTYNAHGQPLTITDPNGLITTLTYDARQRLASREVGGELTVVTYYPTGLVRRVTLPDGSFIENTYDAAHRLTTITDGAGNRFVYTLDAMGNRTAENTFDPSNALSRTRSRVYNTLNRLTQEIGAANQTTVNTYDGNGNLDTVTDPRNRVTNHDYDELNRLTRITDAALGVTQFGYDANDNLTSVTDPRTLTTGYVSNGFGDLTQLTSPDTGLTQYTPDAAGNVDLMIDARNRSADYQYDALNRASQIVYSDQTVAFEYDQGTNARGRLTRVTDASGNTQWTYNAQGRVASKQQTIGTLARTVSYGYNSSGQLNQITTPSGQTIGYGYTNNRVTSVTVNGATLLSQVLYEPFGPTRGWSWANGTLTVRDYDTDWQLTTLDSAGLSTFTFFPDGLIQTRTDDAPTTFGLPTGTANYTPATLSNRLASSTGTQARTYGFDAAGNTTSYTGATFTYNDAGRMISATAGGVTTSYLVNGLGQRVRKSNASTTRLFVYDESGHLLGEYDQAGALIQETVWLEDIPVATLRPNGGSIAIYYVHTDHLNTPRKVTRPSDNAILWRWESDPFGQAAPNEDADGDGQVFSYHLRFPGQYFEAETGLIYNYFRDYDPATGRYPQSDPIGLRGGINTYGYAGANPIMASDPFGLFVDETGAFIQMCAQRAGTAAVAAGSAVAAGVGMMFFPSSTSQCDVVTPKPEANCPEEDDCAKLYAQIDAAVRDLKRRYGQYADDPLGLPATGPFSRRTHREQFEQRQKHLRRLLDEANTKGCLAYDSQAWTWATRKLLELPRSTAGGQ